MMPADLEIAHAGLPRHCLQFANSECRATGLHRVLTENRTADRRAHKKFRGSDGRPVAAQVVLFKMNFRPVACQFAGEADGVVVAIYGRKTDRQSALPRPRHDGARNVRRAGAEDDDDVNFASV